MGEKVNRFGGLAVMGQNLVLNMNDHGFKVAVFNRTARPVDEFVEGTAKGQDHRHTLPGRAGQLSKRPRRVMLMVKAGEPVDDFIAAADAAARRGRHHHRWRQLNFKDTIRRTAT